MVQAPQIARKLAQKRRERHLLRQAVEFATSSLAPPADALPGTGAELVEMLRADGVIGAWKHKDIEDSSAYARELREKAQRRTRD